jgi:hypothetical protein
MSEHVHEDGLLETISDYSRVRVKFVEPHGVPHLRSSLTCDIDDIDHIISRIRADILQKGRLEPFLQEILQRESHSKKELDNNYFVPAETTPTIVSRYAGRPGPARDMARHLNSTAIRLLEAYRQAFRIFLPESTEESLELPETRYGSLLVAGAHALGKARRGFLRPSDQESGFQAKFDTNLDKVRLVQHMSLGPISSSVPRENHTSDKMNMVNALRECSSLQLLKNAVSAANMLEVLKRD